MIATDARDRGAASLLILALGLVMVLAGMAGAQVGAVRTGRHEARTAADLGALAGAMRAVEGAEVACARAGEVVARNDAEMQACRVEGLEVVVAAKVSLVLGDTSATARAGPAR
ncbi:Rv3654c family TadE-like protein [Actinoplanes sp. TFC3]|uniref:Rv3654c family TadE-like protein n=1 Tax=Actinoplanes sp. TFC3 TaxID=1710355 RepID=UPI0009EA49B5|nr:Rv3654c family TadE-like protein [Actinoplanes sp. TFC3]